MWASLPFFFPLELSQNPSRRAEPASPPPPAPQSIKKVQIRFPLSAPARTRLDVGPSELWLLGLAAPDASEKRLIFSQPSHAQDGMQLVAQRGLFPRPPRMPTRKLPESSRRTGVGFVAGYIESWRPAQIRLHHQQAGHGFGVRQIVRIGTEDFLKASDLQGFDHDHGKPGLGQKADQRLAVGGGFLNADEQSARRRFLPLGQQLGQHLHSDHGARNFASPQAVAGPGLQGRDPVLVQPRVNSDDDVGPGLRRDRARRGLLCDVTHDRVMVQPELESKATRLT